MGLFWWSFKLRSRRSGRVPLAGVEFGKSVWVGRRWRNEGKRRPRKAPQYQQKSFRMPESTRVRLIEDLIRLGGLDNAGRELSLLGAERSIRFHVRQDPSELVIQAHTRDSGPSNQGHRNKKPPLLKRTPFGPDHQNPNHLKTNIKIQ